METRDPALSKTRIAETDTHETLDSAFVQLLLDR